MNHFKTIFALCCFLILVSSCSSTRFVEKSWNDTPVFEKGFSGFVIYDPVKKITLFEQNGDKYFTPASNTKLFTFYAGLKILRDSVPALRYQVKNDSLIFSGTGDPSFLNPDLPNSGTYEFLKNRSENLYYLLPDYTESTFGPGWSWDWYTAYYATERTDFPLYGNRVSFEFVKGFQEPRVYPLIFSDSLSISENSFSTRIGRERYSNTFTYNNQQRDKEFRQNVPITFSPSIVAELLSDTLQRDVKILKGHPAEYTLDNTICSVPTDSILK